METKRVILWLEEIAVSLADRFFHKLSAKVAQPPTTARALKHNHRPKGPHSPTTSLKGSHSIAHGNAMGTKPKTTPNALKGHNSPPRRVFVASAPPKVALRSAKVAQNHQPPPAAATRSVLTRMTTPALPKWAHLAVTVRSSSEGSSCLTPDFLIGTSLSYPHNVACYAFVAAPPKVSYTHVAADGFASFRLIPKASRGQLPRSLKGPSTRDRRKQVASPPSASVRLYSTPDHPVTVTNDADATQKLPASVRRQYNKIGPKSPLCDYFVQDLADYFAVFHAVSWGMVRRSGFVGTV